MEFAKVNALTIIAVFELEDRLVADLQSFGVNAYTVGRVAGRGVHGPRIGGLVDAPNLRFELLVPADVARIILGHIAAQYADEPIIAYVQSVEAVPVDHFR